MLFEEQGINRPPLNATSNAIPLFVCAACALRFVRSDVMREREREIRVTIAIRIPPRIL